MNYYIRKLSDINISLPAMAYSVYREDDGLATLVAACPTEADADRVAAALGLIDVIEAEAKAAAAAAGTYDAWMREVNRLLVQKTGVTADDLPDYRWRDAYDDGIAPPDAANDALTDAGYFGAGDDDANKE